ncbi:MAG TPA: class I SAM-dependent methyltransferase [Pseudonocardiaceae bacterium]|jgi:SAM-dependent methyltransferase|nr:class I SAM-dependent methyltransferase [Pseudonocardiaceae bacterium]
MNSRQPDEPITIHGIDFDAVYQGRPLMAGLSNDRLPWDIGQAQPAVRELEASGRLHGEILDIGCGLGDNAIFLAERGHHVTALDGSATAIDQARARARDAAVEVDFGVADATELTGYEDRFDTVLDSALYHCLNDEQRLTYAAALHRVTTPRALLNIMCIRDGLPAPVPAATGVSQENLRNTLGATGWTITSLRPGHYLGAPAAGELAATLGLDADTNPDGHVAIPMWIVEAHRA